MQNEKLKKFTDFFVKYRRYFCAAVLFVILVVILVKCTGPHIFTICSRIGRIS